VDVDAVSDFSDGFSLVDETLCQLCLIATVGDAQQFKSGRQLSAWLGLVPREHSNGERRILLGISKCGDRTRSSLISGRDYNLRVDAVHYLHETVLNKEDSR
jgi:transposase